MDNVRADLVELLEAEKTPLMSKLAEDRSPGAAQEALQRTLDRVTYRYVEECPDERLSASVQAMMTALKAALPLLGSVNDANDWRRTAAGGAARKLTRPALAMLIAGAVLIAGSVLGLYFTSGRVGALPGFVRAVVPAALGGGLVFLAGLKAGRPPKALGQEAEVRREFLVGSEDAWHALHGAMVAADGELDALRERMAVEAVEEQSASGTGPLAAPEAELLANLLEGAYARPGDEDAAEAISEIRYYLHLKGVDMVDYAPERAHWFELLPASQAGTLRPALTRDGRLLKKGLASAAGPAAV